MTRLVSILPPAFPSSIRLRVERSAPARMRAISRETPRLTFLTLLLPRLESGEGREETVVESRSMST